ncbi:MAG: hypothetical protein Q7J47_17610 [Azoarcus sp.]|nr:hypothetical protein [Azoarcus sp.]
MANYDPLWTAEQAHAASLEESARLGRDGVEGPNSAFFQWYAHHVLVAYGKQYAEGDKFALMAAISECARADLPLPEWAARAYLSAFQSVVGAKSKSWDKVFGEPYPKGTQLAPLAKKRNMKFAVWIRVNGILGSEPGVAIDTGLFERVGKEFNLGKTLASEYYYEAKRILSR